MTDKQIIIDGVPVQDCCYFDYENDGYEDSCYIHQNECSAQNCYYKQLKRKEKSEEKLVKQIQTICDFINNRPETFKGINGSVDKIITDYAERKEQECETLASQLDFEVQKKECLEQECEELKKTINEAKNSKLDLKSFLVGEAVQNEYEQQLDQLKAELTRANCQIADDEILQCDMREAIEELKAENEELKKQWEFSVTHKMILEKDYITELDQLKFDYAELEKRHNDSFEQFKQLKAENDKYSLFIEKLCDYAGLECDDEEQAMRTLSDLASQMNKARWIIDRYKQTLAEIKEIAEGVKGYDPLAKQILQKISKCGVMYE